MSLLAGGFYKETKGKNIHPSTHRPPLGPFLLHHGSSHSAKTFWNFPKFMEEESIF